MNDAKYIGMDVHQATISAAFRDSSGNLVMEATLETKAAAAQYHAWCFLRRSGQNSLIM